MTEREDPVLVPEHILQLKDELLERWRQLLADHQATAALVLVQDVFGGEYDPWLWGALFLLGRGEELADGDAPKPTQWFE